MNNNQSILKTGNPQNLLLEKNEEQLSKQILPEGKNVIQIVTLSIEIIHLRKIVSLGCFAFPCLKAVYTYN